MPSTRTVARLLLLAATSLLVACIDPAERTRYHGTDHEFSWEQEDHEAQRMEGLIYRQDPPAQYSDRQGVE